MTADLALSHELRSLREELAANERERSATPEPPKPERIDEAPEQRQLREQLSQLMAELEGSFEEAEKIVAAHPVQSVLGALLLGILIGRLLGRR